MLRSGLSPRYIQKMNQKLLDLYTDYLSVTFGYATATGLSNMLDGSISHDAISRFLSEREYTPKDFTDAVVAFVSNFMQGRQYLNPQFQVAVNA